MSLSQDVIHQALQNSLYPDLTRIIYLYQHSHTIRAALHCPRCLEYCFESKQRFNGRCRHCGRLYQRVALDDRFQVFRAYCWDCQDSVWVNEWTEDRFENEYLVETPVPVLD